MYRCEYPYVALAAAQTGRNPGLKINKSIKTGQKMLLASRQMRNKLYPIRFAW